MSPLLADLTQPAGHICQTECLPYELQGSSRQLRSVKRRSDANVRFALDAQKQLDDNVKSEYYLNLHAYFTSQFYKTRWN
jgi:hypothetical protein